MSNQTFEQLYGELPLDPPELIEALKDFVEYREEIGKPMTRVAFRLLVRKVRKWAPSEAVKAIERSIEYGWVGVYCPKDRGGEFAMAPIPKYEAPTEEEKITALEELKRFKSS